MSKTALILLWIALSISSSSPFVQAQSEPAPPKQPDKKEAPAAEDDKDGDKDDKEDTDDEKNKDKDKDKKKTIAEVEKDCDEFNGLFRVLRNREKGAVYLHINKDQLGKEYIYFSHGTDGVVGAGRFRGRFDDQSIFTLNRHFDKIEFTRQNTSFYFDPQHPLARAADANISHALLAAEPIIAEDEKSLIIKADDLFLKETLVQVKPSVKEEKDSLLGKLSEDKTTFRTIKNYPQNTVFEVEYVYDTPLPPARKDEDQWDKMEDLADRRAISVTIQHTLIEVPKNNYKPRFDDPRIGYFTTRITDQISTEVTPWRDVIHRWDLQKKDPNAPLSEPKEPIVWWMENTTPLEFRDTIRSSALEWNKAFEKAGFKNAIVIKQQPDNADWDAGDIRYNVLRWTSSPSPPFGGYGPSFVNPRTGQILGADIMLEFAFVKNRLFNQRLWSVQKSQIPDSAHTHDGRCCTAGLHLQQGLSFGQQMLRLRAADKVDMDRMIKEALSMLVLHEIGHTLGLNHNFKASHLHGLEGIYNRKLTESNGLTGSVMDYMPLNLGPEDKQEVQYYITSPGPYDDWAITYGYSLIPGSDTDEKKQLAAMAGRSHEHPLMFANDADDMRGPGKAIDPRAMIGDMSSDPIGYAIQRLEMINKGYANLPKKLTIPGQSWQELTNGYSRLTSEAGQSLTTISRFIGGVYVERVFVSQIKEDAPLPLRPVEEAKQQAAMQALSRFAFAPEAWPVSTKLITHLQQQRRGFDFEDDGENPKIHELILSIQKALLEHLLHPNTQNRIVDSTLLGNTYTLDKVMLDLTRAIMVGEKDGATINTFRQNLQLDYVDRLIRILDNNKYLPAVRSVTLYRLQGIKDQITRAKGPAPLANLPHLEHILYKIEQALELKERKK